MKPILWENKKELAKKLVSLQNYTDTVFIQLNRPRNIYGKDSTAIYSFLAATFKYTEVLKPIYSDENKIYLQLAGKPNDEFTKLYKGLLVAEQGSFIIGENKNGMVIPEELGFHQAYNNEGKLQIVYVKERVGSRQKSFDEAKPELISEYQSYLEKEWIKQLKQENTVKINTKLLEKLKSELESKNL
jgi:hypothetical protein